MLGGYGSVYLTTNLATIVCVRKSALCLPKVALLHHSEDILLLQIADWRSSELTKCRRKNSVSALPSRWRVFTVFMGDSVQMIAGTRAATLAGGRCLFAAKPGSRPAGEDGRQIPKRRSVRPGDAGGTPSMATACLDGPHRKQNIQPRQRKPQ